MENQIVIAIEEKNIVQLKKIVYILEQEKPVQLNLLKYCLSNLAIFDSPHAIEYMKKANTYDPNDSGILNNLGFLYHGQKRDYKQSIHYYQQSIEKDPKLSEAYRGIIDVFNSLNQSKFVYHYAKKGLEHCNDPFLWLHYGTYLNKHNIGSYKDLISIFQNGLNNHPSPDAESYLYQNLSSVESQFGWIENALNHSMKSVQVKPHSNCFGNILLNSLYLYDMNSSIVKQLIHFFQLKQITSIVDLIRKLHKICFSKMHKRIERSFDVRPIKNIAYISSDLYNHPVANFSYPLLHCYNKTKYNVFVYSNSFYTPDILDTYFNSVNYRCIVDVSEQQVATMMQSDQIDILIDLSGHTSGNRLDVISQTPALRIVSFIGYPHSVADYPRISDHFTEENNNHDKLYKFKSCFLSYYPFVTKIPKYNKSQKKSVIFGCFCKIQKINDKIISLWSQILQQVKHSKLYLKSVAFRDPEFNTQFLNKFGSVQKQLQLFHGTESFDDHLDFYNKIDIHLDTYPYSGTTITCESLYMNVPVITLLGPSHVSRVSGSILKQIQLSEFICQSDEEYVSKAIQLTKDRSKYHVRKQFEKYMMDYPTYMKEYEELLEQIII
jgi:predicted O-linked N-acetylglucosamine transferase (SPINDLY family)